MAPRICLAVLGALLMPASAHAATVSVDDAGTVQFAAAAGEANKVTVQAGATMTIVDSGATLTASAPCSNVDEHTVTCAGDRTQVDLGDGDDTYVGAQAKDTVQAGPGDDSVDGGGGRDELRGGRDDDTLVDGDATTVIDRDIVDGGAGDGDLLDYSARENDVDVDLANTAGGEDIEGDRLTSFEHVRGGAGDDHLAGTAEANVIEGNGGDDILVGRGGGDHLTGGDGDDWVRGGDGDEVLDGGAGEDRIRCRAGRDLVQGPELGELFSPTCERARYGTFELAPNPRRLDGTTAIFTGRCPDGVPRCAAVLRLRHVDGGQQVLGRGEYRVRRGKPVSYKVVLTHRGRNLARRDEGVVVDVSVQGDRVPRTLYTIKLKTRDSRPGPVFEEA